MPQHVAEAKQAGAVIARAETAVAVEVGYVVDFVAEAAGRALHDVAAGGFQRAEIAAERHLLVIVDALVAEDEDGKTIHAGLDGGHLGLGLRSAEVSTEDFGPKLDGAIGLDRLDRDGHVSASRGRFGAD